MRPITFGDNLRHWRSRSGLTQKQLAEQIGYTEKSISKWETGNGIPPMELLLTLADFFGITLDELVFDRNPCHYFLGIDGGGTKTAFQLMDENMAVVNTVYKGASNPNDIGMDAATDLLKEGIQEVCRGIPYSQITLFAGIAGSMTGNNKQLLHRFFSQFGFFAFGNSSDVDNLIALAPSETCIMVIMGTGFVVFTQSPQGRTRIAGWGQYFDRGGCGYTISTAAISAVLSASDGSASPTLLSSLFQERLGEAVETHLAKFYQGGKQYIASFADLVFRAAQANDPVAKDILEQDMAFVAQKLSTAIKSLKNTTSQPIPILFSGGLSKQADVLFPLIEKHLPPLPHHLQILERTPVEGALEQAICLYQAKAGQIPPSNPL